MTEQVIRSKWAKKYKQALSFINTKFIGHDGDYREVDLDCYIKAMLFYLEFTELVITYNVNINPPIISVISDGTVELEFRKDLLKQRKSPKISVNFIKKEGDTVLTYKSMHLEQNIRGKKNIKDGDFKADLETIFAASALYLDYKTK